MSEFNLAKIIRLLEKANDQGVNVTFLSDELSVHVQKGKQIDKSLLDELGINKPFLVHYFKNFASKEYAGELAPIQKMDRNEVKKIPLSFAQERLWFIDRLEGSTQYHIPTVLRLIGKLNIDAVIFALQNIVNRHEVLRTVILDEEGIGYQSIKSKDGWELSLTDRATYKEDTLTLKQYIHGLINAPFDLSQDYMLRAHLIKLEEEEHILVVTVHHIASDGWSASVMIKELLELWKAYEEKRVVALAPLELQYADFAIWQRNYLQGTVLDKNLEYWENKLEGVTTIQLPTDYQRPTVQSKRGARSVFSIDRELTDQLQLLSQQQGTTIFMTLLAVYKVLLHRYSGQKDICVGTSFARREQRELEGLIGFFVNTLTLRDEVNPNATLIELLQQVKVTTLGAYEHQDIPFEKVVETVIKERESGRNPLFQVMLVLTNTPVPSELRLGELKLSPVEFEHNTTKFEITFFVTETPEGLQGSVQYSLDLYGAETIERMIRHFKELLQSVLKDPQQKIGLLPMLTKAEEQQVLHQFNDSKVTYPTGKSITELFEEQTSKTPGNIAVVFENEVLTYQQLNERSNQLAHYLKSRGLKQDSLVPLYVERSAAMMVAILGIMKAGAAYVPIDTGFPQERISYMLEDAGAKIIVSDSNSSGNLAVEAGVVIIETDSVAKESKDNLVSKPLPNQLAYVIYTSGSTGKPKGVMIEHRNLVDYYYGLNKYTKIDQCSSFALVSTIATDLGNTVLYASLLSGGALHVFSKEAVSNIEYLHGYFSQHEIDCLKIVPSHWKALCTEEKLLLPKKLLVFGGEALQSELVEGIHFSGTPCRVVNHYGPTETTIGKLLHEVNPENIYNKTIPVGKPFSNTSVYVLSKEMQLCPVGIPGQLYIAGDGVARGYFNNTDLTKEKFIADPFAKQKGSKMYGTGDMVKWLADGNIEFIGRVDDQVKIRGYRIEPGEIETVLQQSDLVSQAVVLAKEDKQGNKRLVGYIIPGGSFDRQGIISYLKEKLPDYMVPGMLVELESFPLTVNGKVDRKALPDPEAGEQLGEVYVAPRNETESRLALIWEEVLEIEQVGVHDDFFELGGHSLLAVRLISAIRKEFIVEMPIGDIFDYPTVALLAEQVGKKSGTAVLPTIQVANPRPDHIPLSFSQERLWFIDRLGGSIQYHIPAVLRITGKLNKDAIIYALQNIINRHEVLRTVILDEGGNGYQYIKAKDGWELSSTDGAVYKEDPIDLQQYIQSLIQAPFNLSKDYMLRAHLIKLEDAEHILVVTIHHIASDGWSASVIVKELLEIWQAYEEGRGVELAPLQIQYADYAIWQRDYLQGEVLENKLAYWKQNLEGVAPLQLPTDYARPAIQSQQGDFGRFSIDKELAGQLKLLSKQQGTTLFMTLLAAFKVLLHRYSGQYDICIGTPVAGRHQQEVESLIGFFINTLALRSDLSNNPSFIDMLQAVKATTLEAFAHQEVPFEKVVDAVVKGRDMSRNPIFQVTFVFQNTPEVPELSFGDVKLSVETFKHNTSKFDLILSITETEEALDGFVGYCTALYNQETIIRMMAHFTRLLTSVVNQPGQGIAALRMLSPEEERQLLVQFNDTEVAYPKDRTIVDLFEEQAAAKPTNIALVFEKKELTYKELNERSNQLAHYLRSRGVKEDTMVSISIERSAEMMVGILGILKVGGAYVPIDPEYPAERIGFMLEDTGSCIIITSKPVKSKLPVNGNIEIIEIDGDWPVISKQPKDNLSISVEPNSLAYVIYTSGSTGKPKGVMVTQNNVVSLVKGVDYVSLTSKDILLSTGSSSFDATTLEYWGMLLNGGQLVLCSENRLLDNKLLKEEINNRGVNRMWFTSGWFNQLVEADITLFEKLETILVGGEKLSEHHIEKLRQTYPDIEIINGYGPTENTTFSLTYRITETAINKPIPIGRPLNNRSALILDENHQLVPVGVSGEICLSGAGLSRGYLNRPELTAEKFVKNPFSENMIYKTGDIGRWLPDGNIEYLGRKDEQVKIRGYRIELGEIENVLHECEEVKQAAVLAKDDSNGSKQLVGYIVAEGPYNKEAIINYLQDKLPSYMIPAAWVELEHLPLTSNGKVDKKALPEPVAGNLLSNEYAAPRNEIEVKLAGIWQALLKVERVGIHDNFFELGGHSLLAMRVISSVRKELEVELAIKDLFIYPTISGLASQLNIQDKGLSLPPVTAQERPEHIPLSFSQERLWFIDRLEGSIQYHIPSVLRLTGKLNNNAIIYALQNIVNRHEVLRTVILDDGGNGYQYIKAKDGWELSFTDEAVYREDPVALQKYIQGLINAPFDLSKDYMLRAHLIKLQVDEHILVVTLHHIASDGWSVSVMVKELVEIYKAYEEFRDPRLIQLPIQYADFAIWQRAYLQGEVLENKLAYWKQNLNGVAPLQLPTDYARPAIQTKQGGFGGFSIDKVTAGQLKLLSRQQGTTLFMTLLAAFKVLLHRYTGQDDICVGTPVAGRQQQEVESLIGFFINTLALRSDLSNNPSFVDMLQGVKATTLEAYAHQEVSFEKVVDAVVNGRDMSRNPIFQVVFIFQNNPEVPELSFGEVKLSAETFKNDTSKFDLTFNITETDEGLKGGVVYSTALYKEQTIIRMMRHFTSLLTSIVNQPGQRIDSLPMLGNEEKIQLLVEFNDTQVIYPKDKTIVNLFEDQAKQNPQKVAVVFEQEHLTYHELNQRSNQLAYFLRTKGVKEETLVPICISRSLDMIIGILGILKAGGAYVPIDPDYPGERISYILEDLAAALIVTSKESRLKLPATYNMSIIELNGEDASAINKESTFDLQTAIASHHLAYVIYTSGSTGKPKGAMNEHRGVVNRLCWARDYFQLRAEDSILQKTTFCFDVSVWELLLPIISGSRLVFATPKGHKDNAYLKDIIRRQHITIVHFVPSMLSVFLPDLQKGDCAGLKKVLCSGEALKPSQVSLFKEKLPGSELHNLYGPTEAAIDVTYWTMPSGRSEEITIVPIGRPVSNTSIYILNESNEPAPLGSPGEIYIGGIQVGRGYLNRPELTTQKFIPDLFGIQQGGKLYKTGDLGRWLANGNVEYLGRIDEQVKIRGYRIELGEIEMVIQQSGLVSESVILAREDSFGNKRLTGYVVAKGLFDKYAIDMYLREKLPEYMVPSIWIELECIPLTSNGKIDRNALPDIEGRDMVSNEYVAPRNELEKKLADIWQEVLDRKEIGIDDNFFELGGDSILTIQIVSRLRRLGYELQAKDIFIYQTISRLTKVVADRTAATVTGEQGMLTGHSGLLPIQQWYLEGKKEDLSHFNQSVLLSIDKTITESELRDALKQLTTHHDALRFIYEQNEGVWTQVYGTNEGSLVVEDLQKETLDTMRVLITEKAQTQQRSLNIEKGELVRMALMQTPVSETNNRLLIVIHHLSVDGISWRILLGDLELLLTGIKTGMPADLGLKSTSYRQWYTALENFASSKPLNKQKPYWQHVVNGYLPLPVDKQYQGAVKMKDMLLEQSRLDTDKTRALIQEVPRVYHTEINDILMAALVKTLCEWGSTESVVIGLEGHGREDIQEHVDTSRSVGWFTSIYPVLLKVHTGSRISTIIKEIKEQLRQVPDKGLGYGILKYINKEEKFSDNKNWDIVFNYFGQLDNVVSNGKWLRGATEAKGTGAANTHLAKELIAVNGMVQGGELVLNWSYSSMHYNPATIKALAQQYRTNIELIIVHCIEKQKSGVVFTPSDYGLGAEITNDELDAFLNEPLPVGIRRDLIEGLYRLSGLQEGMLFHALYDRRADAYTEQLSCDLKGPDLEPFKKSWDFVIGKHTILRSGFYYDAFIVPVQCVYREVDLPVVFLDYRGMSGEEQATALKEYEASDLALGFNFKAVPLMRIALTRLSDDVYRMLWTSHHILFDGWSMPVLMEEFLNAYEYFVSGNKMLDFKSVDRYEDYIRYLERNDNEIEEIFWRHYMSGIERSTLLPFIGTSIQRTKGVGVYKSTYLNINTSISAQTDAFAKRNHITINTIMQGIWSYLLHEYTGSSNIAYGVIVSGRPEELSEVERKVGLFINTLPLHSTMQKDTPVVEWLQSIQQSQVACRQYQYTPLQRIQAWTKVQGDLFDTLLVFENYPISEVIASKHWSLQVQNVNISEQTNYPLTITIGSSERINVGFIYNTELLKEDYINEILNHFENVLLQIISNDTNKLQNINLLTRYEKHQLLEVFNNTHVAYPKDKTVLDLFKMQVENKPENVAVIFGNLQLTYKELHNRSNQLAHILKTKGVKQETLVPICIERGLALMVGILGILKVGGVYVPIDPEYPAERINYMIEDSLAPLVIASNKSKAKLSGACGFEILELDESLLMLEGNPIEDLPSVESHQLAYVIYTSGSTGRPKGAGVFHRSIVNLLQWYLKEFSIKEQDNVIIISSHAFDLTQKNLLGPLVAGATVVMPGMNYYDSQLITKCIKENAITIINCAPHAFYPLVEDARDLSDLDTLRLVVLGGEPIHLQRLENWILSDEYDCEIVNSYGPTECTDIASFYRMNNPKDYLNKLIPMGHPNDNVQLFVLDKSEHLLPVGLMGEIYIGGDGVGAGYLRDERLTSLKFIPDPFSKEQGSRLYKTGDLGRWLPDGNIEYLGRLDDQVKIRGHRIELGEIENLLHQLEQVHQAVVLAKDDSDDNKRLVGYLVAEKSIDKEEIISYLRERVPAYMVPSLWVLMESFPLTPNGKVDKKALPDPGPEMLMANEYVAPRSEIEEKIAAIWKDLLHVDHIGIHDSFFELGGHSLLAMRVISAIRKEFDVDLEIKDLFQFSTINELSKYLEIHLSIYSEESNSSEYDLLNI